jgi:DNA repair protein RadC
MYSTRIPTIKHWAEDERPREKFLIESGINLSNAELVAILIGSGSRDESAVSLAQRILASIDNDLERLAELSIQDLSTFKGIGFAKAVSIAAAIELCHKRMGHAAAQHYKQGNAADNRMMVLQELGEPETDSYWIFLFSGSGILKHKQKVGDSNSRFGDPRKVLQIALEQESLSIMLVHHSLIVINEPSKTDLSYTLRLIESANMLSISILDHLIIHPDGHYSYRDAGHLNYLN